MSEEYKGYLIEGDGTYGYKNIKPIGKGSVNLELRGNFTSQGTARQAIDRFLANRGDKVAKAD